MRLKNHYEAITIDEKLLAVPVGDDVEFNGAMKLNKTAAAIFEMLKKDVTEEEIVDALSQRFDAPRERLTEDVRNTIREFRGRGLLAE